MLGTHLKTALVTGASSGIGAAVVRRLRARNVEVWAAARRKDKLDALATETGAHALELDVSNHERVYASVGSIPFDIVVSNAGVGRGIQGFLTATPADIDQTIGTNVLGMIHVARAVLPGMVQRGRGHLVSIGSVAGLHPIHSALYGASKGAVHLFAENLRLELAGTGVRHTEIAPGRVKTEFFEAAIDSAEARAKASVDIDELSADDVAVAIEYVLSAPPHVDVSLLELMPTEEAIGGAVNRRVLFANTTSKGVLSDGGEPSTRVDAAG